LVYQGGEVQRKNTEPLTPGGRKKKGKKKKCLPFSEGKEEGWALSMVTRERKRGKKKGKKPFVLPSIAGEGKRKGRPLGKRETSSCPFGTLHRPGMWAMRKRKKRSLPQREGEKKGGKVVSTHSFRARASKRGGKKKKVISGAVKGKGEKKRRGGGGGKTGLILSPTSLPCVRERGGPPS